MELENKYTGSEYNSFCEYFCELTELLDNITEKKRPLRSLRKRFQERKEPQTQ